MSSNPIDHIDAPYLVGEIAILRVNDPQKVCLLVEGQDDKTIYERSINPQYCQLVISYGKDNLVGAIKILNKQRKITGYLGIKDADFDVIDQITLMSNLFLTDGHDLEVMICNSAALEKYIDFRFRGHDQKVIALIKKETREKIFKIGNVLGYMHWLSHKYAWGIEIHTYRLLRFLSSDLELSLEECIQELKSLDSRVDETKCDKNEYDNLSNIHSIYVCKGHELAFVLKRLVRELGEKHTGRKIAPGEVIDALFLAYEDIMFKATTLFRDIR